MGFDLVAPKHVHGPGCGHTAAQVEADAKPKVAAKTTAPASTHSQFKMAEQAVPRQESQNPKPLEQKSTFLGTAVQRFASSIPQSQKSELPAQPLLQKSELPAQTVMQQSKPLQPQAQATSTQTHQSPPTQAKQQGQSQVRETPQTPIAKTENPTPQAQTGVQKQVQAQQQPPVTAQRQQTTPLPTSQPASPVTIKQAVAVPTTTTVPQVLVQAATPQRLPQALVMTQLSQTLATQLYSTPKTTTPVMSGMLQSILKNMAPPATVGLDGKEFTAMIMSFMMRERVERRKKVTRKLKVSRDVLAVEHPERDRAVEERILLREANDVGS